MTKEQLNLSELGIAEPEKYSVGSDAIASEKEPADLSIKGDDNYLILVSNLSDVVLKYGAINFDQNAGSGQFFPIPATGKNCWSTCEDCFNNQQYEPVLNVSCKDNAFKLTLISEPDEDGNAVGATWDIAPTCDVAGGVICFGT